MATTLLEAPKVEAELPEGSRQKVAETALSQTVQEPQIGTVDDFNSFVTRGDRKDQETLGRSAEDQSYRDLAKKEPLDPQASQAGFVDRALEVNGLNAQAGHEEARVQADQQRQNAIKEEFSKQQ